VTLADESGVIPKHWPGDGHRAANLLAVNIFGRISQAIKRFNRRLASGSTGGAGRDVTMLRESERQQFEAGEDEKSE